PPVATLSPCRPGTRGWSSCPIRSGSASGSAPDSAEAARSAGRARTDADALPGCGHRLRGDASSPAGASGQDLLDGPLVRTDALVAFADGTQQLDHALTDRLLKGAVSGRVGELPLAALGGPPSPPRGAVEQARAPAPVRPPPGLP